MTGRKTPCAPGGAESADVSISAYECDICDQRITTAQALSRHRRNLHHSTAIVVRESDTQRLHDKLERLERQIQELSMKPVEIAPTIIQQNHFVNKVTLNFFGSESIGHITQADVMRLLDEAMVQGSPDALFTNAAMLIYSDLEHPENITAYMPSSGRSDQVMIYQKDESGNGPAWCSVPLNRATPPMVKKTIDMLMIKQPFHPGQNSLEDYGRMLTQVFDKEKEYKMGSGKKQLRAVLVRNREFIKGASS